MDKSSFDKWVEAYIDLYDNNDVPDENHPSYWAVERFVDLEADFPEDCWAAILSIVAKRPTPRILANLASGPMEELLELHGNEFIERIEKEARTNPDFRNMLHSVWEITNEAIWRRLLRVRLDG
ncbi:MAG: hypothetical protein KJN90_09390 [Gammaproteobacteria bacterium]|nr:hypothetical protein [Gammaproteobacteria bacterium]